MNLNQVTAFNSANRFPSTAEVLANFDLSGKRAIVTGGSGGLGLATARALAGAGADVVVGGRAGPKLSAALDQLEDEVPGRATGLALDLADLASVDQFADAVLGTGAPVDFFVANAGVIGPKVITPSGIELGFMTNVVGHAVLASRLAPALASGARLAFLSSFGHQYSPVMFDDINFRARPYEAWLSYGQSKTGCSLLAVRISEALRGRGIDGFSLHPGAIRTEMGRSMTADDHAYSSERTGALLPEDFKTPDQGAATTLWVLTEPRLNGQGGSYLEDCHVAAVRDEPDYRTGVMRYAVDPSIAKRLWETIEQMIGRKLPLDAAGVVRS